MLWKENLRKNYEKGWINTGLVGLAGVSVGRFSVKVAIDDWKNTAEGKSLQERIFEMENINVLTKGNSIQVKESLGGK